MNLYEVTGQLMELQEMAESGEYDEDVLKDTMEGVEGEFEEKAEGYAMVMRNLQANIDALKTEEKRLAERRKTIEGSVEHMKKVLQDAMTRIGKRKFESGLFKFSITKNGGKQPMKLIEGKEIPQEYTMVVFEPDKELIRKALEDGKELDFAELKERGESLRIK